MAELNDIALLNEVLLSEELTDYEHKAFEDMQQALVKGRRAFLTPKQRAWAESRVLGGEEYVEDAENLFSKMDPKKQRQERERAAAVVLPWERVGYVPPKPPGRR